MATLLDYALCGVADVTSTPGFDTSIDNDYVIRKINQATLMIENYTGRRFKNTTYTNEEYDATNSDQLILRQRPVTDTVTLSMGQRDSSTNEDDWTTVETELQFVDTAAGVIDLGFVAGGGWNRYRVTYSAGYATIPADIQEACATLAVYLIQNPSSGTGVKSKQEGQRKVEYFETASGMTGDSIFSQLGIDEILDSYSNYPVLDK